MALSSWPSTPHAYVLPWAIWRFRGQTGPRPAGTPKEIHKYAWEFLKWAAWRRKGALPPRPDIAPRIPSWGWSHLKQLNQAVPIVPPPPPPPPLPVWENSWKLPNPIIWTTWGWLSGEFSDVRAAGQAMFDMEAKTVALQIGQFPDHVPAILRDEFGFKIALWGIPSPNDAQALSDTQADGYIPQIEGPYQYLSAERNLAAGVGQGLSLSTVTTLSGIESYITLDQGTANERISTVEAERLKDLGLTHAWVECYKQDPNDVHFPISKMMASADTRGIEYRNPLIGLYWNVPVSTYMPELAAYGKQMGAYTLETMRAEDRQAFKNL